MATVLVSSLGICIWVMLSYFIYDSLKQRVLNFRFITKLFFGLSLFLICACFTFLGVAVAYYFDYDQTFNPSTIVKIAGGLSLLAIFFGLIATASLNYRKK